SSEGSRSSACQEASSCCQEGWRCHKGEFGSAARATIQRDRSAWRVRTIATSAGAIGFPVRSARDLVSVPNDSVKTQTHQGKTDRLRTRSYRIPSLHRSILSRNARIIAPIQSTALDDDHRNRQAPQRRGEGTAPMKSIGNSDGSASGKHSASPGPTDFASVSQRRRAPGRRMEIAEENELVGLLRAYSDSSLAQIRSLVATSAVIVQDVAYVRGLKGDRPDSTYAFAPFTETVVRHSREA